MTWQPNFHWIAERLAVGGSYPAARVPELARAHGVRAVIDLRGESRDDERLLRAHGMTLLHLPTVDTFAPSQAMLDDGVAFARARTLMDEPVLIHCEYGIGRAPTLALCVLADAGEQPLAALERLKTTREIVSMSPVQYEAWAEWLRRHGHEAPSFDAFAEIAYRHLR